jgi:hypothetical protein
VAALSALMCATWAAAGDFDYDINEPETHTVTLTSYTGTNLDVAVPDSLDGRLVTGIGEGVFSYCDVVRIAISSNVTSIHSWAFERCNELTNILVAANNSASSQSARTPLPTVMD